MKRKSVITCSLMLVVCLIAKMFGYSYSTGFNKINNPLNIEATKDKVAKERSQELLSFADEMIPLGDEKIDYKMKRALKANSFRQVQTLKLHQRAERWFPVIEPVLKAYGIPEDFKYIPLVETGMARGKVSPKGAAGLWQFMPQTAKSYGLKVNSQIDERTNVYLSTVAAAKYLKDLYKVFNSWTLVAAAYNVGEGSLQRQINRQGEDNYFRLKLNRETGRYVYSLISMKEVIEKPEKYGYQINNPRKLLAYQP
nr:lytic transglycosylase domain-containing protein [Pedobacter glucosidilyticus]